DYFSPTGQRWGNPLYRWDRLAEDGYRWWIDRMAAALRQVDLVRLDHFRGLEKYYEIPASEPTALRGRWVDGPGEKLLAALREGLGALPFIAEDLGMITPEVGALRDQFDLPGMRVLQFAFNGDSQNPFLPHNYVCNCVAYTATHDNDTTVGWLQSDDGARHAIGYLNSSGKAIHWDFIRAVLASVADLAIIPLQDILGLGSEARMNLPGSQSGNWRWRLLPGQWSPESQQHLANLTHIYGRTKT
ncbi:MAG: 4-alpha-glucanotransferase, partial [Acidobacteriota bacterium]